MHLVFTMPIQHQIRLRINDSNHINNAHCSHNFFSYTFYLAETMVTRIHLSPPFCSICVVHARTAAQYTTLLCAQYHTVFRIVTTTPWHQTSWYLTLSHFLYAESIWYVVRHYTQVPKWPLLTFLIVHRASAMSIPL